MNNEHLKNQIEFLKNQLENIRYLATKAEASSRKHFDYINTMILSAVSIASFSLLTLQVSLKIDFNTNFLILGFVILLLNVVFLLLLNRLTLASESFTTGLSLKMHEENKSFNDFMNSLDYSNPQAAEQIQKRLDEQNKFFNVESKKIIDFDLKLAIGDLIGLILFTIGVTLIIVSFGKPISAAINDIWEWTKNILAFMLKTI